MADLARILVVSTDDFLSEAVGHALRVDRRDVGRAHGWRAAERMLPAYRPHLIVIDAESESVDERPVVDRVRMVTDVPLIVLSPSTHLEGRLAALQAGADEVMPKPFTLAELVCRIDVLLRRNGHAPATFELGDLVVDERAHTVDRAGHTVELTPIEFGLLLAFCRNCGHVLTKDQLLTMVWGFDHYNLNLVEVHVSGLRRKLERYGPRIVHTVRGAGYALRPARRERPADPVGASGPDGEAIGSSRVTTGRVRGAVTLERLVV